MLSLTRPVSALIACLQDKRALIVSLARLKDSRMKRPARFTPITYVQPLTLVLAQLAKENWKHYLAALWITSVAYSNAVVVMMSHLPVQNRQMTAMLR
jgi:hypothetical protein